MITLGDKSGRTQEGRYTIPILVLVSMMIHALIVARAKIHLGGGDLKAATPIPVLDAEYSCWSDASLAMAARNIHCALPGIHDEECNRRAWGDFRRDLALCDGLIDDEVFHADAIAFMTEAEFQELRPAAIVDVPEVDEVEASRLFEEEIAEKMRKAQEKMSNPRISGQVVEVTAPDLEISPETARFLSEYNTKVEKETVARASTEKMVPRPSPEQAHVSDNLDPRDESRVSERENTDDVASESESTTPSRGDESDGPSLLAMRAQEFRAARTAGARLGASSMATDGLPTARRGDGPRDQDARESQDARTGAAGNASGGGAAPNLRLSEETLSRFVGGGSVDKLDGVETGEVTALNSRRWKFAGFFNRMKREVAQFWHPNRIYLHRDPTGKVYGNKDRVTILTVSLEPGGRLSKILVSRGSGVAFLDEEAVRAFRLAQPFPNPPKGLVDTASDLITFQFGFHFQIGERRRAWKILRYD